jgi:hypothetical protein
LKNGIERMLMHYVPEVKGVEQVSDIMPKAQLAASGALSPLSIRNKCLPSGT